jgi:deazaflavin-dependent oxidoreductase (nitroreductase family)
VKPLRRLGLLIGRQPWLPKIAPRLVTVDAALQRRTGGRIAVARFAGLTALLLTTTGRRSGLPRTTPLTAVPDGDALLLVGSNWAKPTHPAWSSNLIANPDATVEIRGHTFDVTARHLTGEERSRAWARVTEIWPPYKLYAARTDREIRIFRLTRR